MKAFPEVKLDWGIEGIRFALKNGNIVVVDDTLRFSSTVVTATANGFTIYPISDREKGLIFATSIGAEMSGKLGKAKFSLSPISFLENTDNDNKNVVLYSPNGATCSELVKENDVAYIGCLLNAKSVGEQVTKIAKEKNRSVTIIAAGETRAVEEDGKIVYLKENDKVFALEDYLGCGAIISYIKLSKSPEAKVCESAFKSSKNKLKELLLECFSGKYLVQNNLKKDVDHAAQLNYYNIIPIIRNGKIERLA